MNEREDRLFEIAALAGGIIFGAFILVIGQLLFTYSIAPLSYTLPEDWLRDNYNPAAVTVFLVSAIALAEVQGIKLKAELIDFQRLEDDAFIGALKELFPEKKSAYQLRDKNRNPWEQIYVFLLQDRPVGMTSPFTLVCTAQKANWEGVPWYEKGQLHSPLSPVDYLTKDDKMQLWLWLDNLCRQLGEKEGDSTKIKGIIKEYQAELKEGLEQDITSQNLRLHNNERYFGVFLELGRVTVLSIPIQPLKRDSSVKLVPSRRRVEEPVLFMPEKEELLEQWSKTKP